MQIRNVHERALPGSASAIGALLDSLASPHDRLWPGECWPPLRLDGPLRVGSRGGHGPVRYFVEEYEPGHEVVFRFTRPSGFHGTHRFEIAESVRGTTMMRQILEMNVVGTARITWPLFFRPLHDALIEDAFDKAEADLTEQEAPCREYPARVKALRWLGRSLYPRRPTRTENQG